MYLLLTREKRLHNTRTKLPYYTVSIHCFNKVLGVNGHYILGLLLRGCLFSSPIVNSIVLVSVSGRTPVMLSTTRKSPTYTREAYKCRNIDRENFFIPVFRLFSEKNLLDWQYHKLLQAYTKVPSRTASDTRKLQCICLKLCKTVETYRKHVFRADYYCLLACCAVVKTYCSQERDWALPVSCTKWPDIGWLCLSSVDVRAQYQRGDLCRLLGERLGLCMTR
jgi:hypothetical protein